MSSHNEASSMTLVRAVETLSNIADLDDEKAIGIANKHLALIQNKPISHWNVHWLSSSEEGESILNVVRETFKVILDYLRNFYSEEFAPIKNPQAVEGIKTMMVLVGEAAKKLDKFTNLFKHTQNKSVTEFNEYKELQEFYLTRVAKKVDEAILGKWVLALSQRILTESARVKFTGVVPTKTKHVFVDLESVKKDSEYELFFLRKEDGSRFFSPRLIRNIKLICDFGDYFGSVQEKREDPLQEIDLWVDQCCQNAAKMIVHSIRVPLDLFYRELYRYKERDIISHLNKTFMALLMSSHSENLKRHDSNKSCGAYFIDFQRYLRETLQSKEYENWIENPPKPTNKFGKQVLNLIHSLCKALFTDIQLHRELSPYLSHLAREGLGNDPLLPQEHALQGWERIAKEYLGLSQLFKHHPNGPLIKVLNALEKSGSQLFDPLMQNNLPTQLFSIIVGNNKILNLRIPSPTSQEFIHKATLLEEFKGFLRSYDVPGDQKVHLYINLQDRTGWRECSRCHTLEKCMNGDFDSNVCVVTLPVDTDFFHQLPPYNLDNHAELFLAHLKEHFGEESSGFLIPNDLLKQLKNGFLDGIIQAVHRVFFSSKNVLLRESRINFIEIFYFFLILKLLEITKPASFSLSCKDGVDIGSTMNTCLYVFLKLISHGKLEEEDHHQLNFILHSSAFLVRERPIQTERFNRMLSAIKAVESIHQELGHENFSQAIKKNFAGFFEGDILNCRLAAPNTRL